MGTDVEPIITRDMEAMVRELEAEAADYRRLMRNYPNSKDWDTWDRKEERARKRANRYRVAVEQRKGGTVC